MHIASRLALPPVNVNVPVPLPEKR